MEEVKKRKVFKDYYQDEAYRIRHQAYMQAKIECPYCECSMARANIPAHKRTKKHKQIVKMKEKIQNLEDLLATKP